MQLLQTNYSLEIKTLHDRTLLKNSWQLRFSPINHPSHESLCRPGLVVPKIEFYAVESSVCWSENCTLPYNAINAHLTMFFVR